MDFFSQWTGGKIKIRLEKPAANISKLVGGKNEKAREGGGEGGGGFTWKTLVRFIFYLQETLNGNQNNKITEYVICRQEAFWLKFYDIYTMYSRKK